MTGRVISHYRIEEKLGEGGMGTVYRAVDVRLDRPVAIKILTADAAANPERKRRFFQEARAASALNHPNIITVYDVDSAEVDGQRIDFIAMEYVRGKTLFELIDPGGLPVEEALQYSVQIADALAAAHGAGIVHRDLKPPNIMVTGPEGGHPGLVKVLDFGVAKLADPGETQDPAAPTETLKSLGPPRTAEGTIVGTVAYMSPEQAEGKRVDARSDIFSFGSVFYEMLTGRRAFAGDSQLSTLTAILRDEPAPAAQWATGIPPELESVLHRCLRKDPERRFQSAADLKVVLRDISERQLVESLTKGSTATGTRELMPVRRPPLFAGRRWIAAAAVVLAALLAASRTAPVRERLRAWLLAGPVPAEKQIAVLPFQNVGSDAANQAFCDGLVETLTTALTQLEQFHGSLWVVPAVEVRRRNLSSASGARSSLGVNLVITGSVQRAGNQVRITTNLVDAATLRQLRARSIDTRLDELAGLQDLVVQQVAALLELELAPQARRVLSAGGTTQGSAYDLYLQARGTLLRYDRAGNTGVAIALLEKAVEKDPRYAQAYLGLGQAYMRRYSETKDGRWLERAQAATRLALQQDDRVAPAHVTLALVLAATGRNEASIQEFEKALQIDPVSAEAYREMAQVYETMGRRAEAEAVYRKAIQLRPADWVSYSMLGAFYYRRARYTEAEEAFRRTIELTPDNSVAYRNLGGIYIEMGRKEEAAAALQKSASLRPSASVYSNLGVLYYDMGRYRDAVTMFEKAVLLAGKEPNRNDYVMWGNLGDACRWTPELADKAPGAFRKAIEAAQRQLDINPNDARVLASVANFHAKLAENDQALALIARARRLAPADLQVGYGAVLVYELTGNRSKALAALENILHSGYSLERIGHEPELAQLRRDPGYGKIVANRPPGGR